MAAAETVLAQLDQEQVQDLLELVKRREWTSLLHLFRLLEATARVELEGFSNLDEAFERRGKLLGIRLGLEIISNLSERSGTHGSTSQAGTVRPTWVSPGNANSQVGITVPLNPADEPASGPSY